MSYSYIINLQIYDTMLGKTQNKHQVTIFQTPQVNFINMYHELVHLAQQIDWVEVENVFKGYFSLNPRPSVPIRNIVGLMLLKNIYNLSDEGTVTRWVESPYFQYYIGEYMFQIKSQIDPTEFSKFRRRAGIEPVICHFKQYYRIQRNYMKGNMGDSINTMMAVAGFNLKHWLNKVILIFYLIYRILIAELLQLLTENRNRLTLQHVGIIREKRGVWND